MEGNKYFEQISTDLYYYKHMHRIYPERIFISHSLWSILCAEDYRLISYKMDNGPTYGGIPVQVFISGKLEYYFVSSGFVFEDEEDA
jgi:hypothetical protein